MTTAAPSAARSRPLIYNWGVVCTGGHPDALRCANPGLFGPGKGGWVQYGEEQAACLERAKKDNPQMRFKMAYWMPWGWKSGERFSMNAGSLARAYLPKSLGNLKEFLLNVRMCNAVTGTKAAIYCGEPGNLKEFLDAEGPVVESGLVDEYMIDATANRTDPESREVFRFLEQRGIYARLEAWPGRMNERFMRSPFRGAVVRDNIYASHVLQDRKPGRSDVLKDWAIPRTSLGSALMICITAGRDQIKEAREWLQADALNCVALSLSNLETEGKKLSDLLQSPRP